MLPSPNSSPTAIAARQRRAAERFAQARKRVLDRNGLTDADAVNMAEDDAARSFLADQIMFEWLHSDWAKQQDKIEGELRNQEDAADVAERRMVVLTKNATDPFPYPPELIKWLLRHRVKELEKYSNNLYWSEMFGGSPQKLWQPSLDAPSVIAGMTAEALHKQAFYIVGESDRLTKLSRRRRQAQLVLDLPKYALAAAAVVIVMFVLGITSDLLEYLHRAPTVVALRNEMSRVFDGLFTDEGFVSALVAIAVVMVFVWLALRAAPVVYGHALAPDGHEILKLSGPLVGRRYFVRTPRRKEVFEP
jgi:hypothetical protein